MLGGTVRRPLILYLERSGIECCVSDCSFQRAAYLRIRPASWYTVHKSKLPLPITNTSQVAMLAAFPPTKQITPNLLLHHSNNGFNGGTLFMLRHCSFRRADPIRKVMWWVHVTHSVPSSLRVPCSEVTEFLAREYLWKPFERIESLRPALRFRIILRSGGAKALEVVM